MLNNIVQLLKRARGKIKVFKYVKYSVWTTFVPGKRPWNLL